MLGAAVRALDLLVDATATWRSGRCRGLGESRGPSVPRSAPAVAHSLTCTGHPAPTAMQPLSADQLDAVLAAPAALVYKHSTRCPISAMAHEEMRDLAERRPDVPLYIVDVHAQRGVSREIAERLGVTHHSPQLILVVNGEAAWDVSHFEIRAKELLDRMERVVEREVGRGEQRGEGRGWK